MKNLEVNPIGKVVNGEDGTYIEVLPQYIPALKALDGFSHLQVIWWFSDFDSPEARTVTEVPKPYKNAPEVVGIFATFLTTNISKQRLRPDDGRRRHLVTYSSPYKRISFNRNSFPVTMTASSHPQTGHFLSFFKNS